MLFRMVLRSEPLTGVWVALSSTVPNPVTHFRGPHSALGIARPNLSFTLPLLPKCLWWSRLYLILLPANVHSPLEPFWGWPLVSSSLIFIFIHHLETKLCYPVETRVSPSMCSEPQAYSQEAARQLCCLLETGTWLSFALGDTGLLGRRRAVRWVVSSHCGLIVWLFPTFLSFHKSKSFREIQARTIQRTYMKFQFRAL